MTPMGDQRVSSAEGVVERKLLACIRAMPGEVTKAPVKIVSADVSQLPVAFSFIPGSQTVNHP